MEGFTQAFKKASDMASIVPPEYSPAAAFDPDRLHELLRRYWGYEGFLPNQAEAVEHVIAKRDSLVILPTGGGKSK